MAMACAVLKCTELVSTILLFIVLLIMSAGVLKTRSG